MINHKAYVEQALAHTLELPVNAWGALGPGRPAPCGRRLLIIQRLSQLSNVVRCCAVQNYPSAESWRWYLWPTRQAAPGQTHFEPFPNSFELLQIFWALFGITTTENVKPASDNARQASEVERLVSEGRVLHYSYRSIRGYLRCSQCKTAPHFSVGEENLKLGQMWRQNLAHPCAAHSWQRSEKRATFTPTENLWLHGEWWVGFFGGRAVRFMFRARPFVIMAECKQTDIIWRLLHPPGSAIVTRTKLAEETPRKGQRGFLMNIKGVTMWLQHRTRMNHLLCTCFVPLLKNCLWKNLNKTIT